MKNPIVQFTGNALDILVDHFQAKDSTLSYSEAIAKAVEFSTAKLKEQPRDNARMAKPGTMVIGLVRVKEHGRWLTQFVSHVVDRETGIIRALSLDEIKNTASVGGAQ